MTSCSSDTAFSRALAIWCFIWIAPHVLDLQGHLAPKLKSRIGRQRLWGPKHYRHDFLKWSLLSFPQARLCSSRQRHSLKKDFQWESWMHISLSAIQMAVGVVSRIRYGPVHQCCLLGSIYTQSPGWMLLSYPNVRNGSFHLREDKLQGIVRCTTVP